MIKDLIQEAFILKTKGYYKHAIETFYRILELDNSIGIGYKSAFENKDAIDSFISLFGVGETNEKIYFK